MAIASNAFSKRETVLVAVSFLGALLLNLSSANAVFGKVILSLFCVFSLSSPMSALVALSASQVVADPLGVPLTLFQALFVCWPIHLLLRRSAVDYRPMRAFVAWTIPATLFFQLVTCLKWNVWPSIGPFELAIAGGIMGAWYVGQLQGRWILALLCLGVGALPSVITFWLRILGVAIEGIIAAKGIGAQAGVGVGRGDGNLAGVSISIASTVILAVALSAQSSNREKARQMWMMVAGIALLILSAPAIAGTMSRGGVVSWAIGLCSIMIFGYPSIIRLQPIMIFAMLVTLASLLGFGGILDTYARSMIGYSEKQMAESIMMSRDMVWRSALSEVLASPVIGTTPETRVEAGGYGYDYCSHNVWLDFGRGGGIPGLLWFAAFFVHPLYRLVNAWGATRAMPFIAAFAVFFGVFMSFSLGNYKTFYILWCLTYAAALFGGRNVARGPTTTRC